VKLSRGAIALYVGVVFASGAVLGVFGQRLYTATAVSAAKTPPTPEQVRKRNIDEARERVHLTDDQVQKMDLILDETLVRYRQLNAKEQPEIDAIRRDQTDRINAILSPDQRKLMEELRKERREKAQKKRGSRPGGPPGPGL
jgi:Spy/CpxP family protein refolding chaperone